MEKKTVFRLGSSKGSYIFKTTRKNKMGKISEHLEPANMEKDLDIDRESKERRF